MLIAAFGCVLAGVSAAPVLALTVLPGPVPRAAMPHPVPVPLPAGPGPVTPRGPWPVDPGGPMFPGPRYAAADLLITVRVSPSARPLWWTLTCGPVGGTLPHPARACRELNSTLDPFAPLARGIACPMIYYGPQTATITGWWHGTWIEARFSRTDGCQAERWNKVGRALVLPVNAPVNPGGPMLPGHPPGPMLPGHPPGPMLPGHPPAAAGH